MAVPAFVFAVVAYALTVVSLILSGHNETAISTAGVCVNTSPSVSITTPQLLADGTDFCKNGKFVSVKAQ